jgi:SAM-dependent methyltransferase
VTALKVLSSLAIGTAERWLRREDVISTIIDDYGPQIGEMVWHSIHFDAAMHEVTRRHAERMRTLIDRFELSGRSGQCRKLEVGAYAQYSVHLLCAGSTYEGVTHDISPNSLRLGTQNADEIAAGANVRMVAGVFHDLPFDDATFDLVFIASAVHHTFRPHLVLRELLRVTRPSGVVHIENEPLERALCFYQYRGNRPESYTGFERALIENDVRSTLESPFGGARPEALFGMIENDRIPLDVFLSTLTDGATVRDMELAVTASADLDAEVITACRAGGDIAANVFTAIERRMRKAASAFPRKMRYSGSPCRTLSRRGDYATKSSRWPSATLMTKHWPPAFSAPRCE